MYHILPLDDALFDYILGPGDYNEDFDDFSQII